MQHALALRKKQLQDEGNLAAVASLPQLTCFERGSSPGGVWRADRNAGETNMYEALFTNGEYAVSVLPDTSPLHISSFRSNAVD